MCDTLVHVPSRGGAIWFGKNSDREPSEAQVVEHRPRASHERGSRVATTYLTIAQAPATAEVVLSRPAWMWGAEMGANEHGVVVGNEAVFTRLEVSAVGLTGMDLVRLALERARTAQGALEILTTLLATHGQGGDCGFRQRRFRYHNAFAVADQHEAWILETAGPFWAAERVRGSRALSNGLSIGERFDLLGPDTEREGRRMGTLSVHSRFSFRRAFADPVVSYLTGAEERRSRTLAELGDEANHVTTVARALRSHAGLAPSAGLRMRMPCAHASWLPTRVAGQTTGTQVSRLADDGAAHFFTGTSAPCLSVLKPVPLGGARVATGPAPHARGADASSLFWRHERFHRAVMEAYRERASVARAHRVALEARGLAACTARDASALWEEHREALAQWTRDAEGIAPRSVPSIETMAWRALSQRDGLAEPERTSSRGASVGARRRGMMGWADRDSNPGPTD